jgi:zinc transporter, ZIP family
VSFEQTVVLAAIAGLTILLGLPVGRLRGLSTRTQAVLTAAAAGVILFLLWDILSQAVEPVEAALDAAVTGDADRGTFAVDALVLAASVSVGLLSIVWLTQRLRRSPGTIRTAREIAIGTAVGLGLHNFSEGLAIGQSAASGATAFALILVVGFALHNATEGFGIAAPLTTGERPTWGFLVLLGLIGGGPTTVGGILGYTFASDVLSIAFLGLAAGALIYVLFEMMAVGRKFAEPMATAAALLLGLFVAFATDFLLVAVGA